MKTKIAINGFGRIGRNAFRVAHDRDDLEIVAINDLADTKTLAHLLGHDTVYGAYNKQIEYGDDSIVIDGKTVKVYNLTEIGLLPWGDLGVDIVIESTGKFTDSDSAMAHINPAGAKKVIVTAPVKDGAATIVIGVNEDKLEESGDIISNASCTTNCIAPIMDIINQNLGVQKAMMSTVHSYTASQKLHDGPAKDLREARAAAVNIIPTSTGASISATKTIPELEGLFGGLSVRVPTPVVSLADLVILTKKDTTISEINDLLKKTVREPYYQGILDITEEELVSSDFIGNSHSAIIDLNLTNVVGGNLIKIIAWYDNEWGYSNRLVELAADLGKLIDKQTPINDYQGPEEAHI